jgi:hypothetical protein
MSENADHTHPSGPDADPTAAAPQWSRVGDELLILDTSRTVVHRLGGEHAAAAEFVLEHPGTRVPLELADAVTELHARGILSDPTQFTRRRVIAATAVVTAAGMASVALPSAAAAASEADEVFSAASGYSAPENVNDTDSLLAGRDDDGDVVLSIQQQPPPATPVPADENLDGTENTDPTA